MGHIRLGRLPKTQPWQGVFGCLASDSFEPPAFARETAAALQQELTSLKRDPTLNYCFWVLTRLATASRTGDFQRTLESLGVSAKHVTSRLAFLSEIARAVSRAAARRKGHPLFSQVAELALRETLASSVLSHPSSMFADPVEDVQNACRSFSTRKAFGETGKRFFAHFLSRCVRYVIDKELSNRIGSDSSLSSPEQAVNFHRALDLYCYQSAKIVEDYAGGWLSKHNWETNNDVPESATRAFTAYAVEKLQLELRRDQP